MRLAGGDEWICKNCDAGEGGWLRREGRRRGIWRKLWMNDRHKMENKDKVLVLVLDKACESAGIQRAVEKPYRGGDLLEARPCECMDLFQ